MIIATLIILGASLTFLSIAFVAVVFIIVLPMRAQLSERVTLHSSEQVEAISRRADEISLMDKTNHLDVRGDIVRLSRRVEELEDMLGARATIEVGR